MTKFNTLAGVAIGFSFVVSMAICVPVSARAGEINWGDYMHSAFSFGAIAAAISRVGHCSKQPLLIEEYKDDDGKRRLVFTCDGTEEEEASSILQFERFGDGPWLPDRFSFAG